MGNSGVGMAEAPVVGQVSHAGEVGAVPEVAVLAAAVLSVEVATRCAQMDRSLAVPDVPCVLTDHSLAGPVAR